MVNSKQCGHTPVNALEDTPENEDVNSSFHKECVDNDHKNTCGSSVLSKDDVTKFIVNGFNCKKSNVDVLTEVHKTVGELFPCLNQSGSKGATNKFELLVKSVAQFLKKKNQCHKWEKICTGSISWKKCNT